MHGTNVQATNIAYATMMIAMSIRSEAIAETAYALFGVATSKPWLPEAPECADLAARIVRKVWDTQWSRRARATLADPEVQYLADAIYRNYSKFVPYTPDDVGGLFTRAQAFYAQHESIQQIARAFLELLDLPNVESAREMPRNIPHDRLIQYLKALVQLKPLFDQHQARKAKQAATKVAAPAPAPQPIMAAPLAPEPVAASPAVPVTSMPFTSPSQTDVAQARALQALQTLAILQAWAQHATQASSTSSAVPQPTPLTHVGRYIPQHNVVYSNPPLQGLSPPS